VFWAFYRCLDQNGLKNRFLYQNTIGSDFSTTIMAGIYGKVDDALFSSVGDLLSA